jgi:hypothetical protein
MAEPITEGPVALRTSPLSHLQERMGAAAVTGARGVTLAELPFVTMVNVRVDPASEAAERSAGPWVRRSPAGAATPPPQAAIPSCGSAPTSGSCCPGPTRAP